MVYNSACFYFLYTPVTEDPQRNTGKYNLYSKYSKTYLS